MDLYLATPSVNLTSHGSDTSQINELVDPLLLTVHQINKLMDTLQTEMWLGLSRDETKRKQTSLQMENTYVTALLDGSEEGDFLALDLGSTNFRVLLSRMVGGKCESVSRNYNVPKETLTGPSAGVFDHLAESIYMFLKEEDMLERRLPLGFTFSFPMVQKALNKAYLITWTKSFACPDGPGEDVGKHLEEAIKRRKDINVDVVAVLNDTTGTLMAGSYLQPSCSVGLILGTGCNAAYVEKVENVDKWEGRKPSSEKVVIDIEWGAFGDNGSLDFIKTKFDQLIDQHSNYVGSFTFEKLLGGYYIGDIVRLALVELTEKGLAFGGKGSNRLREWGAFTASHITRVEKDTDDDLTNTSQVLQELSLEGVATAADVAVVRYLCSAVSIRAAQLLSAGIAVLLKHMGHPHTWVAIDGSLYRYHPKIHDIMTTCISKLAPDNKCTLILAEDGSGRGAAFVAAVAVRLGTL